MTIAQTMHTMQSYLKDALNYINFGNFDCQVHDGVLDGDGHELTIVIRKKIKLNRKAKVEKQIHESLQAIIDQVKNSPLVAEIKIKHDIETKELHTELKLAKSRMMESQKYEDHYKLAYMMRHGSEENRLINSLEKIRGC